MSGKRIGWHEMPERYVRPGDKERMDAASAVYRMGIITCGDCSNPYHRDRPRCPTCGWKTPPPPKEKKFNAPRFADAPDACAFCRRKSGTLEACGLCTRKVHRTCRRFHTEQEHMP